MLTRILGLALICAISVTWPLAAKAQELPQGWVIGGFVTDDGSAALFVTGTDESFLVDLRGAKRKSLPLPARFAEVEVLADGRFLLKNREKPRDSKGNLTQMYRLSERRGDRIQSLWKWNSRDFVAPSMHTPRIRFSPDGLAWGIDDGGATQFMFGRTRSRTARPREVRIERADIGRRDAAVSGAKWPMDPKFIFLDSDGPVVLVPWSGGAYILHFAMNDSSPYAVPILFENGVEEYDFRWQWEERVLWARTSLYWKAYNLWDLGLSPMKEDPFLVVDQSVEPHPVRGAVRIARQKNRYRAEHVWRDPWSPVEERHVSDWRPGSPSRFFVSPNGRHAVVVEPGAAEEGESRDYARRIELRLAPPLPLIEPDLEAEATADREVMPWLKRKSEENQGVRQEAEEEGMKNSRTEATEPEGESSPTSEAEEEGVSESEPDISCL